MACERPEPPRRAAPVGPAPSDLAAGEAAFASHCAQCHGPSAIGSERGPPLAHPYYASDHHGDEAFQRAVQLGVAPHHWNFGAMPPVDGLTRDQVAEIIAYVRWVQRQNGIE